MAERDQPKPHRPRLIYMENNLITPEKNIRIEIYYDLN